MIKQYIICLLFLCKLQQMNAADIKYLLYHTHNQVKLKNGGKEENAKRGVFISNNQSLILSALAEVMLVQNDGKSMLLNKPGTYTFLQIKNLFSKTKTNSVTGNFFSYVFEKFLNGGTDEEKQKVSASVYRGKRTMLLPADSSIILSGTVVLKWVPQQKNIPYKITLSVNDLVFDTVIRSKTTFTIPASFFKNEKAGLLKWAALPSNSKETSAPFFISIIPLTSDLEIIQTQINQLKKNYSKKPSMLRLLENDLFERWLELYALK